VKDSEGEVEQSEVMVVSSRAATMAKESSPGPVGDLAEPILEDRFETRFQPRRMLGEGGMGEVHLYADRRIGREVALKLLKDRANVSGRLRFLREARVQGQLEHPSVVPVYDMGITPEGGEFFTMKRIGGATLADVLDDLASDMPSAGGDFSRNKLLAIFRQVCLGVHYAHRRGVIHRDLKPANIMVGDFGEVYILDWGLARVRDADAVNEQEPSAGRTVDGQILGTPGYMAPEQALASAAVDERADVYALGAILFEMLTLRRLHEGASIPALLYSTQSLDGGAPSERTPEREVPPELDRLCWHATRVLPSERLASAGDLASGVERFLEGDRDLALRRTLARTYAERAAQAASLSDQGGEAAAEHRREALQAAGQALVLDPTSEAASRTLLALMTQLPTELPRELEEEIEAELVSEAPAVMSLGTVGYLLFALLLLGGLLPYGIRDWATVGLMVAPLVACAGIFGWYWRLETGPSEFAMALICLLTAGAVGAATRVVSPWALVPSLAVASTAALNVGNLPRALRWWALACGCLALAVPTALERLGVLTPTYMLGDDGVAIISQVLGELSPLSHATMLGAHLMAIVVPCIVIWRMRDKVDESRRSNHLQRWQLRQLVPDQAGKDALHANRTSRANTADQA
jgi:eukaryotic-like serine/threonine-protein kinase